MKQGNIVLMRGASISNLRGQPLAADPELVAFTADHTGVFWMNTTEGAYKYFDGSAIQTFSKAGDLPQGVLLRDGSVAMAADLILSSTDQSESEETAAASKGHVDTVVAAAVNVGNDSVVVTDANGKLEASTVTKTELGHLTGVTSAVQTQIDSKQADLGYTPLNKAGDTLAGDINAGGFKISDLGAPEADTDAARKIDIDNAISGMNWLEDIAEIQVDATLDPEGAVEGERYILTDVLALHVNFGSIAGAVNNCIVEHDGTEFVVVFDPAAPNAGGALAWNTLEEHYVRYDGSSWSQFGGISAAVAGDGLEKTGNVFNIKQGDAIHLNSNGELSVNVVADRGLAVNESNELDVVLNGLTLKTGAEGLSVNKEGLEAEGFVSDVGGTADHVKIVGLIPEGVEGDTYAVPRSLLTSSLEAATATAGQVYVYDKTGAGDTAATVHTFAHNAGSRFGTVTVFDEAGYQIIPDEIIVVDENTLRVELSVDLKVAIAFVAIKAA